MKINFLLIALLLATSAVAQDKPVQKVDTPTLNDSQKLKIVTAQRDVARVQNALSDLNSRYQQLSKQLSDQLNSTQATLDQVREQVQKELKLDTTKFVVDVEKLEVTKVAEPKK